MERFGDLGHQMGLKVSQDGVWITAPVLNSGDMNRRMNRYFTTRAAALRDVRERLTAREFRRRAHKTVGREEALAIRRQVLEWVPVEP
jgi:hypothetical protein